MQFKFSAISLSHKTAPVQIRELIALDDQSIHSILIKLKEFFSLQDALILSTCNRTEVYYSHELDLSSEIIKLIGLEKGIPEVTDYLEYFELYKNDQDSVSHLFRVAVGLEAQVVGDIQIANQVKRAYQTSVDLDMAGPFLHRLMHTVFFTNKRVVQETAFRDGAASLSYATIELMESLTSNTYQPRILLIGLGEIGEDVAKNMVYLPDAKVKISNRTQEKAEIIAAELGFEVVPFDQLDQAMDEADVIVSSIHRNDPFITKELISRFKIQSYKLLIDLSVPRSIETTVEEVPGVILYNVDNIRSKASEALDKRLASIPDVEKLISESIDEFYNWKKEMMVSPTINKLKQSLEQIRLEEMSRFLKNASEDEVAIIDKITKSMMQKILKVPVIQLKNACKRDEAEEMIEIISDLFDLDKIKSDK
ncbi:glutamyl-tRNA reductase [Algoriphagus sp. NF]|jgi:glutamyl-tRNA reductase|uniref:Glutamyl-tRNA reductase n=2 Tax=Algoriphagus TaxID=246875 RepID=A0ABS7N088_9BACT|nr:MULTISPECIES: glutamyl-tRNA reductase [Algoriphagus]MBY5949743.1 glutamyl-tRNA reductase [Algoriphagus marincola]MDE0560038.1 glutamyl-tRNA reductase [Algoriphagus sp. NF]TDK41871.1 glutamyl-tRNA reductase [Algoriphagus aquimaris]